jgi:hypothetical protein
LVAAAVIIVVSYPGIVLGGGSLAPSNLAVVVDRSSNPPIESGMLRPYRDYGMQDLGAPLWQLEPATRFVANVIKVGENPLWNPYSASGTPSLATLADIKTSPFVIATGFFGASPTAYTFVLLGFVMVATYVLIDFLNRDLHLTRQAAVAGGIVFVINGFAVSYLVAQMGAPYFLFPFVLVSLVRYVRSPSAMGLLAAGVAHAALMITTFFPVVVCTVIGSHVLAWAVTSETECDARDRAIGYPARQVMVFGLGLGLAAVVILPITAQLMTSDDFSLYQSRELGDRSPWLMFGLGARFHLWRAFDWSDYPTQIQRPVWTMYVGITVLLALAAGMRRRGDWPRLYVASWVLMIAGLLLHTDTLWYGRLGDLPFARAIRSDYWAALIAMAIVILVPLSLRRIDEAGLNTKALIATAALVGCSYTAGYAYFRRELTDEAGWRVLAIVIAVGLISAVMLAAARNTPRIIAVLVAGLIAAELLISVNHAWPPRTDLAADPPEYVEFLMSAQSDGRLLNAGRSGLYPEWGSAFGVEQLGTLNIGHDEIYTDWFQSYVNPRGTLFLQVGRNGQADPNEDLDYAAINTLSVRYVAVEERMSTYVEAMAERYEEVLFDQDARVHIFRNNDAFPSVYVAPTLRLATDRLEYPTSTATAFTTDEGFYEIAVAAGVPSNAVAAADSTGPVVNTKERSNSRLLIEVDTSSPAVLVVTDNWHRNWQATVNGEPATVGRVNGPVRAVVVPEGSSVVELRYRDASALIGGAISILSLIGVAVAGVLTKLRNRRPGPNNEPSIS